MSSPAKCADGRDAIGTQIQSSLAPAPEQPDALPDEIEEDSEPRGQWIPTKIADEIAEEQQLAAPPDEIEVDAQPGCRWIPTTVANESADEAEIVKTSGSAAVTNMPWTPTRLLHNSMTLPAHRKKLMDEMAQRNAVLLAQLMELEGKEKSQRPEQHLSEPESSMAQMQGLAVPDTNKTATPPLHQNTLRPRSGFEPAWKLFGEPIVMEGIFRRTETCPSTQSGKETKTRLALARGVNVFESRAAFTGERASPDVGPKSFYYEASNGASITFQPRKSALMRAEEERLKHENMLLALTQHMHDIGSSCTAAFRGVSQLLAEVAIECSQREEWDGKRGVCDTISPQCSACEHDKKAVGVLLEATENHITSLEEEVLALIQSVAIHRRKGRERMGLWKGGKSSRRRSRSLGDARVFTERAISLTSISEGSDGRSRQTSFSAKSSASVRGTATPSENQLSAQSDQFKIQPPVDLDTASDPEIKQGLPALAMDVPHPLLDRALDHLDVWLNNPVMLTCRFVLFVTFFVEFLLFVLVTWVTVKRRKDEGFLAWIAVLSLVLLSVPMSCYDIFLHLYHFRSPLQIHYIKIMALVPFYSLEAWLSVQFVYSRLYVGLLRELYEAYVLYVFLCLMTDFLHISRVHGRESQIRSRGNRPILPSAVESKLIPSVKAGVFQYIAVRVVFAVAGVVVPATDNTVSGRNNVNGRFTNPTGFKEVWFWQALATNACQTVALVMLGVFIGALRKHLKPLQIYRKFIVIILVIFCSVWQKWLFAFAVFEGILKPPFYGTRDPAAFEYLMLVVELSLCTGLMHYSFSHLELLPGSRLSDFLEKDGSSAEPLPQQRAICGAVVVPVRTESLADAEGIDGMKMTSDGRRVSDVSDDHLDLSLDSDGTHAKHVSTFSLLSWLNSNVEGSLQLLSDFTSRATLRSSSSGVARGSARASRRGRKS